MNLLCVSYVGGAVSGHYTVTTDDYQRVFACLCGDRVPDVDFSSLFLSAARRGCRDIALLLASRVPDLAVKDQWGQTALIMAARLVRDANVLLVLLFHVYILLNPVATNTVLALHQFP